MNDSYRAGPIYRAAGVSLEAGRQWKCKHGLILGSTEVGQDICFGRRQDISCGHTDLKLDTLPDYHDALGTYAAGRASGSSARNIPGRTAPAH